MRTKVGIFFGGPSREREISFAGGRTVYDNLNKALFEPVPIFVDSDKRWYLLDWQYLYKGSIRDFFPPVEMLPVRNNPIQIYQESLGPMAEEVYDRMGSYVGRQIRKAEIPELIEVAFLALHGNYGEDGEIQAELEYRGIPYTGSGVEASQIGMDKSVQKALMEEKGFPAPAIEVISRTEYFSTDLRLLFERANLRIGWPMVIRPANQGSSIGVSILHEKDGIEGFQRAVEAAFFYLNLPLAEWHSRDEYERQAYLRYLSDLRDGLAFPVDISTEDAEYAQTIYTPEDLVAKLDELAGQQPQATAYLQAHQSEERVLVEAFIEGREFSCIVLRTEAGGCVALPPTEIVKGSEVYDYRSKYLPGLSRKITPIDLSEAAIEAIRKDCERLFTAFGFGAYARIDGFYQEDGTIYLNDPNTTSGMMPSSFFFHQAAEIGLGPSELLTYILRISLWEREQQGGYLAEAATILAERIDAGLRELSAGRNDQQMVAVLLGGYNAERHISVESGRNVFEKLSGGGRYRPLPIYLSKAAEGDYQLHILPLNLLLKDNADDIKVKLDRAWVDHPSTLEVRRSCASLIEKYANQPRFAPEPISWEELAERADLVFIALHGRPGEDGGIQTRLQALGLPYNGSEPASSRLTIDKYETLSRLRAIGMPTARQLVIGENEFLDNEGFCYERIEAELDYPLVAKPVDDGCSAAVKLIRQRDELYAYCHLMFRTSQLDEAHARRELKLKQKEEFPHHPRILFEQFIERGEAIHFLEITGGMITRYGKDGELIYEVFEPSETPAGATILSLEEKFLAGEGQNITPARLATGNYDYDHVADRVKADLERAARELMVSGYCRVDAFVRVFKDGRVETIVIEINSLPGMTPATAIFHQAALLGYKPHDFIDQLLQFGLERQSRRLMLQTEAQIGSLRAGMKNPPAGVSFASPEAQVAAETLVMETNQPTPELESQENIPTENRGVSPDTPRWKQLLLGARDFVWSNYFLRNLGVLLGVLLLGFFFLQGGLRCYTKHGQSMELPQFEGLHISEARELAASRGLTLRVQEGQFDKDRQAGLVILQEPPEGSRIKRERSIYLTILSSEPDLVTLPNLVGNYDYDVYTRKLEALDIEYFIADEEYDPRQEEGTILHFYHDDRQISDEDLRRGVQIPEGSRLGFVITKRRTGQVIMPDLICQTYGESEFEISASQLLIGEVEGNFSSRSSAYIVRTEPAAGQSVAEGRRVRLVLSDVRPSDCQ